MEQTSTLLKKRRTLRISAPRKFIIDNILNYSKSVSIVRYPIGNSFAVSNN